jgi:polyisoprenoid-binding protein YceI
LSSATLEVPDFVQGNWAIDSARSSVRFSVSHMGVQTVRGTLSVRGRVVVTAEPVNSSVSATISVESVATGSRGRDKAIRSPRLTDTDNHPTASFLSTGVRTDTTVGDSAAFLLDGELTWLGVTRYVPLRIRVESIATDGDRLRLVVTGRGQLDRRDFGLIYRVRPRFLDRTIGDIVSVEVRLEASP